jgi:hypothetical protein
VNITIKICNNRLDKSEDIDSNGEREFDFWCQIWDKENKK